MDVSAQQVRYVGSELANTDCHDGQLRPVVGVHHVQVLRANHTHPEMAEGAGWTYNHASMLANWNARFYLEYLSNPVGEHCAPGQTLLTTSADGMCWDQPIGIFPIRRVPEGVYRGPYPLPSGIDAIMHQHWTSALLPMAGCSSGSRASLSPSPMQLPGRSTTPSTTCPAAALRPAGTSTARAGPRSR